MKKLISILLLFVMTAAVAQVKKETAEVQIQQGVYIFFCAKPLAEYSVLGTVKKTGLVWTGKPNEMFNTILRRAKKDYPETAGIIFDNVSMTHATCIKFK